MKTESREFIDRQSFKRFSQVTGKPSHCFGFKAATFSLENDFDPQNRVSVMINVMFDLDPLDARRLKLRGDNPANDF